MARSNQPGPPPHIVRAWREAAGLTRAQAAELVYAEEDAFSRWECPVDRKRARGMPLAAFELFCIKVDAKIQGKTS